MKKITSENIIAKVVKDYKIEDTSWYGDAIDWIGDAIEGIGYHCGFVSKISEPLTVKNHRVVIPCDLISLKAVDYEGYRLLIGSDNSGLNILESNHNYNEVTDEEFIELQSLYAKLNLVNTEDPTEDEILERQDLCDRIDAITNKKCLSRYNMVHCVLPYYNINSDYIQTSFSEGCVRLIYQAFDLDEKGFPRILDTYKYREAVMWRIVRGTLLQGYKHPVVSFEYADKMWEEWRYKAACEQKMPSLDKLERFKNRWLSVKRGIDNYHNYQIGSEQQQGTII